MKRIDFIRTTAGFAAALVFPGCYLIQNKFNKTKKYKFRDYQKETSIGNVKIVTPDDGFYIHTFFDICPFSPSQKYLAVSKLPYQNRNAVYPDTLDICVIDLENETIANVYSTKGWGFQLGANLNWGTTDRYLYTNDIIDNNAVCVRIDLETNEIKAFAGPMYHIAPDESAIIGFPLDLINNTQMGYGVPKFRDIEEINGAPSDEGLWHTNLLTNQKKLLVSLKDTLEKADDPEYLKGGNCYFFHSKFNQQGTRIFQVMRCLFPEENINHLSDRPDHSKQGWNPMLFTFNSDGSEIKQSVTRKQWSARGNHPNWHPDGNHIVMNLTPTWLGEKEMCYCMFQYTGNDFRILSRKNSGSGHPSINLESSYLLVDFYVEEYKKLNYKECPIKIINLNTDEDISICTVFTDFNTKDPTLRLDPHPSWSRDYNKVCFNGAPEGKRQVFVADLNGVI
jgi:hypothetical protein